MHCYRILGSVLDAEDLVQETLLAAWRGLGDFEERASLRSWLYRIATNRCLNALRDSSRRPDEVLDGPAGAPEPSRYGEPIWLQPYPDSLLDGVPDRADGPDVRYDTKEAVALAFVSGLQRMPPTSARCSCCATCSAIARTRWRRCSTPRPRRSTAHCNAPGLRSTRPSHVAPETARCPARPPSASC